MQNFTQPNFTEAKYSHEQSWQDTNALPADMHIERAQTQTDVNATVLNFLAQKFMADAPLKILDLPCGRQEFAGYMKHLFPQAQITAVDIVPAEPKPGLQFHQMDLSKPFTLADGEQYDLVTSVSGIMMFSNTKLFLESCIQRLKQGGTFVVTNDNATTLKDKLTFLLYGNLRMFPAVYADKEEVTENVPIQEVIRILRINGLSIKDIVYTSSNTKDRVIWPLAAIIYPLQKRFLKRFEAIFPAAFIKKMYPFKHLFCRHYIIIAEKVSG